MNKNNKISVCFYARLPDINLFDKIDFYSNDIKILKDLGYNVILSNSSKNIPLCDIYFIWWWSSGIVPLIKSIIHRKPSITIGNIHFRDPSSQGYAKRPFLIKLFIKFSLKKSDVQLATSKVEYDDLLKFKPKNPQMIYHAVDSRKYFPGKTKRENIILTISRLLKLNVERKKILEIIEAFSKVLKIYPDYTLIVAGRKEDDGYQLVIDKINELNLNSKILLPGSISDEEKINLLRKAKVYVQPTDYEGFGMAIAESMACGTPVVTSARGAVPEIAGECALYVDPNSPKDISDAIIRLISDNELFERLSKDSQKRIQELFSYEKRKNRIKQVFEEIIGLNI